MVLLLTAGVTGFAFTRPFSSTFNHYCNQLPALALLIVLELCVYPSLLLYISAFEINPPILHKTHQSFAIAANDAIYFFGPVLHGPWKHRQQWVSVISNYPVQYS